MIVPERSFFARPTLQVAHDLIGMVLVHASDDGVAAGVIVEVEAYIGENDPGLSRGARPDAPQPAPLRAPRRCLRLFQLRRALAGQRRHGTGRQSRRPCSFGRWSPFVGLDLMRARRSTRRGDVEREWTGNDADLCRGPGNLTRALAITGAQNRAPLGEGPLRIEHAPGTAPRLPVAWSPRIGIRVGQDRPWRAYVPGHPSVSGRPR